MERTKASVKFREWLQRYIVAEVLGTLLAIVFAYVSYRHTHSYALAAGAGFIGEGIGFYGYFILRELLTNGKAYAQMPLLRRLGRIIATSSTNLIVEFAPAEVLDNIFIRPFLMFYIPQRIHPYAIGFIIGKLFADAVFYILAIIGYETKKRLAAR